MFSLPGGWKMKVKMIVFLLSVRLQTRDKSTLKSFRILLRPSHFQSRVQIRGKIRFEIVKFLRLIV